MQKLAEGTLATFHQSKNLKADIESGRNRLQGVSRTGNGFAKEVGPVTKCCSTVFQKLHSNPLPAQKLIVSLSLNGLLLKTACLFRTKLLLLARLVHV